MRCHCKTVLALLLLCLTAVAPAVGADAPAAIDRLAHAGRLWGTVRYLDPYIAYRDIDWDAALIAALPKIRAAKTTEEYRAAVQGMLDALGDPVTRVVREEPPAAPPAGEHPEVTRTLDGGVLYVNFGRALVGVDQRRLGALLEEIPPEVEKASAVVVDLRMAAKDEVGLFWSDYFMHEVAGRLVTRPTRAPTQRYLLHSGFRPQDGGTSGGYYSGFLTQFADLFEPPDSGTAPKKVVFLVDEAGLVPPIIMALQAAGSARLVAEGKLSEASAVTQRTVDLGEGLSAQVRVSEIVPAPGWTGLHADVELPPGAGDRAVDAALAELRKEWTAPSASGGLQALPDAVFRPDKTYADMKDPDLDYRQLAVIRAWNVIHYFYPYLPLIGDWDAVLPEFLARMETAGTGRDYGLAMLEMMAHVADGHTAVWGRPEVEAPFGNAYLPVYLRWVEGAPVVVRVGEEGRKAGLDVGDAVLSVDGEPVAARIERVRRYITASTEAALLNRISSRYLLVGEAGSTAALRVRKLDGSEREVSLVRDPKAVPPPADKGDVVKILPGNFGYVDLPRLTTADVDGMFEKVAGTRGLIFDMRGYPQGTAWPIAPRINTLGARTGAQFRRSQVGAFSEEEAESGFYFAQPLPPDPLNRPKYTPPIVMLIDDRAISQSEHSGLFYEAAHGTKFIGTNSAGANGDVTRFSVPGGLQIGFTGHDVRHADGRQLQRIGLVPDVEVAPTRAGLAAGRDEVLERAVRYLDQIGKP